MVRGLINIIKEDAVAGNFFMMLVNTEEIRMKFYRSTIEIFCCINKKRLVRRKTHQVHSFETIFTKIRFQPSPSFNQKHRIIILSLKMIEHAVVLKRKYLESKVSALRIN